MSRDISGALEAYWDKVYDRQCDEEELERQAEEMGITPEALRKQIREAAQEAQLERFLESQRD